ncbi:hypothetical protein LX36DRAFT_36460 [Colletotrichum falcatum]|nr:hypothetical protein LX36DRAFT_36460 [Colletotrichum falcatum]
MDATCTAEAGDLDLSLSLRPASTSAPFPPRLPGFSCPCVPPRPCCLSSYASSLPPRCSRRLDETRQGNTWANCTGSLQSGQPAQVTKSSLCEERGSGEREGRQVERNISDSNRWAWCWEGWMSLRRESVMGVRCRARLLFLFFCGVGGVGLAGVCFSNQRLASPSDAIVQLSASTNRVLRFAAAVGLTSPPPRHPPHASNVFLVFIFVFCFPPPPINRTMGA